MSHIEDGKRGQINTHKERDADDHIDRQPFAVFNEAIGDGPA